MQASPGKQTSILGRPLLGMWLRSLAAAALFLVHRAPPPLSQLQTFRAEAASAEVGAPSPLPLLKEQQQLSTRAHIVTGSGRGWLDEGCTAEAHAHRQGLQLPRLTSETSSTFLCVSAAGTPFFPKSTASFAAYPLQTPPSTPPPHPTAVSETLKLAVRILGGLAAGITQTLCHLTLP
ncbi:hypothetical protein NDU88_004276 [Pleurodeles waltl]|uniref:Uncharacterized protein n=1 Tax=Pleurodeles waltl TaxID=8319 RepID=A0AAV7T7C6_PLEWA|nr:hypothetical protein NDU88_004276 [Pleurodeles waltl]